MAWIAVDDDGTEHIFSHKPSRVDDYWFVNILYDSISLPKGSIKKLIDKELTWNDESIELK